MRQFIVIVEAVFMIAHTEVTVPFHTHLFPLFKAKLCAISISISTLSSIFLAISLARALLSSTIKILFFSIYRLVQIFRKYTIYFLF